MAYSKYKIDIKTAMFSSILKFVRFRPFRIHIEIGHILKQDVPNKHLSKNSCSETASTKLAIIHET